jgi:uncharacterized protein
MVDRLIADENIKIIVTKLTNSILEIYGEHLKSIILFGSYARGDYEKGSDIDIMLLLSMPENKLKRENNLLMDEITEISLEHDVVVSIIDKYYDDFIKYKSYVPFYANVYTEGVSLYAS